MTVAFVSHSDCLLHDAGPDHPECPQRLRAIREAIMAAGLDDALDHRDAPRASREQLERVHDPAYVQAVFDQAPRTGRVYLDPDTSMNPHSLAAARCAAGAAVLGVDLVMRDEARAAFCAVRPPGHHAERARAMGFCIFNNVAVGAAHALAAHGLQRVAIVDFDVHHGNGTEDIFRDEPRVLFCSSFQHPYYPFSGADTSSAHILNLPLPAGTDGAGFQHAVAATWLPALDAFRPQLVMVSAGFDGHRDDQLAGLNLLEADYAWITREICSLAERCCDGRVVSLLEGGYALPALGRSAVAHVRALMEVART